jgi:hypothetical protein
LEKSSAKASREQDLKVKVMTESLVSLSLGVTQLCFRAVAKDWPAIENLSGQLEEMVRQLKTSGKVEEI